MDSPSPIRPNARARFGERWGGDWFDRKVSPSRLIFGIVRPTDSDRAFVRELTNNDKRTDVVQVAYGEDQLNRWRYLIQPVLERSRKRTNARFTIGVDPVTASIYIEENPLDPGLRDEIDALGVPEDAYTLKVGGGTRPAHSSRFTFPPYEGGLNVIVADADGTDATSCTSWFTGKRTNGTPRGVTAGHCNADGATIIPGQHAFMGGEDLGTVGGNTYVNGTDSDAVRIAITSSELTNRIYSAANEHRTVKAPRYQKEDLKVSLYVCHSAVSTSVKCGDIVRRDFSATDIDGIRHDHLFETEKVSEDGDSGGPVYGVRGDGTAKVAGIVHGSTDDANHHMVFHGAGWVLNDLDMCIYYKTSPCDN